MTLQRGAHRNISRAKVARERSRCDFRDEVLHGLRREAKKISCKFLYDDRGSKLFDQICQLEEYYLTRTELAIMKQYADQMGQCIGEGVMLVEYGSGSSLKTRILLDHLADPVAYAPVDISRAHLHRVAEQLAIDYPRIEVLPVAADFTQPFELPRPRRTPTHTAVYFPGSTIGNFLPEDATRILTRIADTCGTGGGLLIGIDLQKDSRTLEQAYNDSDGVTAEFNLNLLQRLQRELDSDIDTDNFDHVAVYNQCKGRVELYVRSNSDHTVSVAGEAISFRKDELVHTEYSHKYTVDGFARLAEQAGLALRRSWSDKREYFAVLHFCVD